MQQMVRVSKNASEYCIVRCTAQFCKTCTEPFLIHDEGMYTFANILCLYIILGCTIGLYNLASTL